MFPTRRVRRGGFGVGSQSLRTRSAASACYRVVRPVQTLDEHRECLENLKTALRDAGLPHLSCVY